MQNVIGNFIEPVIYASALNVRNVACLMSLLFWGFVWGIPGMILAMPILIFVKILVEELADYDSGTSEGEWSLINCLAFIISPPEFSFGVKLESISFLNATERNASPHELQRLLDDPTLPEYNRIVLTYSAGMSGEERRATLTVTPFSSDEKRAFYRSTGELIGLEGYCVVKKIGKAPLAVTQEGRLPSGLDLWDLANSVWLSWESKEGVEAPTAAITAAVAAAAERAKLHSPPHHSHGGRSRRHGESDPSIRDRACRIPRSFGRIGARPRCCCGGQPLVSCGRNR